MTDLNRGYPAAEHLDRPLETVEGLNLIRELDAYLLEQSVSPRPLWRRAARFMIEGFGSMGPLGHNIQQVDPTAPHTNWFK